MPHFVSIYNLLSLWPHIFYVTDGNSAHKHPKNLTHVPLKPNQKTKKKEKNTVSSIGIALRDDDNSLTNRKLLWFMSFFFIGSMMTIEG